MSNARMILREETLYRTELQWSPDGRRMVHRSHRGSQYNNLYLLPVTGGEPYEFTHGDWDHSIRAGRQTVSRSRIFQTHGVSQLRILRIVGGADHPVTVRRRIWRRPMGSLEVTLNDAASGNKTAARVYLIASDGRTYVPEDAYQRIPLHRRPETGSTEGH